MNKFDKKIKDDADFLSQKLPNEQLPESLSLKNIQPLYEGKKQKTARHTVIRRIISGAVAACLVITGVCVYNYAVYSPIKTSGETGTVVYAKDYKQITDMLESYRKSQKFNDFLYNLTPPFVAKTEDTALPDVQAPAASNGQAIVSGATENQNDDFGKTNNQVLNVDEADIVKTDGQYIYIASAKNIHIVKALPNGKMETASEINIFDALNCEENTYIYVNDLYIFNNYIAVNVTRKIYNEGSYGYKQSTGTVIFDTTNKSLPTLKKCILQDGEYVSSRVINNSIVLISQYSPFSSDYSCGLVDYGNVINQTTAVTEDMLPGVYYSDDEYKKSLVEANDIVISNSNNPDGFIIISKINLADLTSKPKLMASLGGNTTVYCTQNTLYTAVSVYDYSKDKYSSHTDITSYDITAEKPIFKAAGSIDGVPLNNFSFDEYNGYLRVAAHLQDRTNSIYVLNNELKVTGKLLGLAENENIMSVRFSAETGYVVTFLQTDPLFVIDLSNPNNPVLSGELKLPGFSSYLHPVNNNLLLGIGYGGTEEGTDGSAKLSLFDVSDAKAPKEIDSLIINDAEFINDYKAFTAVESDGSYIIPVIKWGIINSESDDAYFAESKLDTRPGAIRVKIENNKIVKLGNYEGLMDYCERATYIGNTLYAVSVYTPKIISFNLQSSERLDEWQGTPDDTSRNNYSDIIVY